MTPRSFFNIVLKIIGIFFIKDILQVVVQLFTIFYMVKYDRLEQIPMMLAINLLMLLIYLVLAFMLIFRTDRVIDRLKLDQGFQQENFPLNIHRSTVISISIIIIGGLLVADEIPNLCRQLFSYWQEKKFTYGTRNASLSYSIVSTTKIVIGFLLMGNQRVIVNFIERKRKSKPDLRTWDSSADNGQEDITQIK
jgi:hypothetical protein